MATNRVVNGVTYQIPDQGDSFSWGTGLSAWVGAVTNGMLQKAGGLFALTAEVDFGANYGVKALYIKSRNAPANSGVVQLGNTDVVAWAGLAGGGADVGLSISSGNYIKSNTGFDAGTNKVVNVVTPTAPTDAATKGYVDGASTPPAGSSGQIQYNGGSSFAADANLTYSTQLLTVNGVANITTVNAEYSIATAHRDAYANVGIITSNHNINCAVGVYQDIMLTSNPTLTFQNAGPTGFATTLTLYIRQSANGGNSVTWANNIWWSDNSVPVLSVAANTALKNTASMFTFTSFDGGTVWLGSMIMGNVPNANIGF